MLGIILPLGTATRSRVYQILPNAAVDLGCNFGITNAAPDYQPFVGLSVRF